MTELYIFSQDDKLLTILTEETGLISAPVRVELNQVPETPFSFTVEADSENAKFVADENQVVFRDEEGDLQLFVIKEIDDLDNLDGPQTTAICEPGFMELSVNIIEDRRFTEQTADVVLNAAVQGTRYTAIVEADLGRESTNFYRISSLDAIWQTKNLWGGDLKAVITMDDENNITSRQIKLVQRLGADKGHRFEINHNATEIQRTVLSYPKTAMYGWGASLQTEGGGNTRYIDFGDVEWSVAKGDPVDKPKGQTWVGDPDALLKYGLKHNGELLHQFGQFSNQDYDDPEELLWATWNNLQENTTPEVNYRLVVDDLEGVSLGDTAIAIDRQFSRPIEIQTRIIALEYDLLDIEGTKVAEMGQFLSVDAPDDRINQIADLIDKNRGKWESGGGPIDESRFPNITPFTPSNFTASGAIRFISLSWNYDAAVYISHYEVYASQVKDFVPDTQHIIYKGRVSGCVHEAETDQVWYYRVRAVNHHGTASPFSQQISAATHRVISDDILFGVDIAARLRELSEIAPILADGTLTFEQFSDAVKTANGTRFKGDLIAVEGTSYIAEGVIGTAAIANLAVKRGKIDLLAVSTGQIENLAVINGKIGNLAVDDAKVSLLSATKINATTLSAIAADLGEVTAGTLRGVYIYGTTLEGATVRSSNRTNFWDENYTNRAYMENGQIIVHSKGISTDPEYPGKVEIRDGRMQVTGSTALISVPSAYQPPASNITYFQSGSIVSGNTLYFGTSATATAKIGFGSFLRTILEIKTDTNNPTFNFDGDGFRYGKDNNGAFFASDAVYNRTRSGSANLSVDSYGTIGRVTSATKYKTNITEIDPAEADSILLLKPKKWFDKKEIEVAAMQMKYPELTEGALTYVGSHPGLIAEDLIDAGLDRFVIYEYMEDGTKEVEGIMYDRLWTMLIPVVRKQGEKIEEQNQIIKEQNEKIGLLTTTVNTLQNVLKLGGLLR